MHIAVACLQYKQGDNKCTWSNAPADVAVGLSGLSVSVQRKYVTVVRTFGCAVNTHIAASASRPDGVSVQSWGQLGQHNSAIELPHGF